MLPGLLASLLTGQSASRLADMPTAQRAGLRRIFKIPPQVLRQVFFSCEGLAAETAADAGNAWLSDGLRSGGEGDPEADLEWLSGHGQGLCTA
jgi:hypothetical protein